MARYLPAIAMGGLLYLDGEEETYCDPAVVDMLVVRIGHRKAQTKAELLRAVRESERGLPALRIWIREELREIAQSQTGTSRP